MLDQTATQVGAWLAIHPSSGGANLHAFLVILGVFGLVLAALFWRERGK